MKIQSRILLLLASIFVVSLATLAAVLFAVILPAFEQLDNAQAVKNLRRIEQGIANELQILDQKVVDWGHWTETYLFVESGSLDYIAANLQAGSLLNLNVDFMAFYDGAGKTVWAGGYDPETEQPRDFAGLSDPVQMSPLLGLARMQPTNGLLIVDGQYYLVSAGDIFDSDGNGPSRGTLVIGRAFDDAFREELAHRTEVTFTATPGTTTPAAIGVERPAATNGSHRIGITATTLVDRLSLPELAGAAPLDLDIETYRDASSVGQASIIIAGIMLVAMAFAILLIIAYAINVLVVGPIRRINTAMSEVASSADLEKRLAWSRRDEFGTLAGQFDHMLEQLALARRDLLELTFKIGRSDLATGMFHNIRNALSPLANQLHRAAASLAPAPEGHVDRALMELGDEAVDPVRRQKLLAFLATAWSQAIGHQRNARRDIDAAAGQMAAIEQILNQQHNQDAAISTESLQLPFLLKESLNFFGADQLAVGNVVTDPSLAAMPAVAVQRLPMIHVIYNVIANAISAIEARGGGDGRILVRASNRPEKSAVRLEIVDNGIGVELTSLADLFRPGYTTKTDKKGGEGLHWCANTMAACGGRIWAESAGPGKGMTILIDIPHATAGRTNDAP